MSTQPILPERPEAPHVAPLNARLAGFEAELGRPVGRFDPADGGVRAEVLLLRRDPRCRVGDQPVASLDDDHPAAVNLRTAVTRAGLDRARLAVWHLVPWYLEDPEGPNRTEVWRRSVALAESLWPLLSCVSAVVLLGGDTQRAWTRYAHVLPEAITLSAPHPSPLAWHRRNSAGLPNSEAVVDALRRAAGRSSTGS